MMDLIDLADRVRRSKLKECVMITPDDKDYITILDTLSTKKMVVIMHYHKPSDEYIQTRCSQPADPETAQRIATNWAAATKLDIR